MAGIRKHYNNQDLAVGCLKKQKQALLSCLRADDAKTQSDTFANILAKVDSCSPYRPCNSKYCPTCSDPKSRKAHRKVDPNRPLYQGIANATEPAEDRLASNYQARGAQIMAKAFDGAPLDLLHPVTINLAIETTSGNLKKASQRLRKRLRRLLDKFPPGTIVRGRFDMALKYADELEFELPQDDLPESLQGEPLPHVFVAMVHIHMVVYHPSLSRAEIRTLLVNEFPGKKRVCIRKPQEDKVDENGHVTGGIQGYLEYASLEKIEVGFGLESGDAALEYARIDQTWTRRNTGFRYGKKPILPKDADKTECECTTQISSNNSPNETNKTKRGFAQKFIRAWNSNPKWWFEYSQKQLLKKKPLKYPYWISFASHSNCSFVCSLVGTLGGNLKLTLSCNWSPKPIRIFPYSIGFASKLWAEQCGKAVFDRPP